MNTLHKNIENLIEEIVTNKTIVKYEAVYTINDLNNNQWSVNIKFNQDNGNSSSAPNMYISPTQLMELKEEPHQNYESPIEQFINALKEEELDTSRNTLDWRNIISANSAEKNGHQYIRALYLYESYTSWATHMNTEPVSSTKFGIEAKKFLYSEVRSGKGVYYRIG